MGFKVVLTISFSYPGLPHDEGAYSRKGIDFVKVPCDTEQEIIAAASDADAVLTVLQPFGRKVMEKLTKCKLIHCIGIGYDGIDVKAATEYGICVSTPADYCLEEVSDHAMSLILAWSRRIIESDRLIRAGRAYSGEERTLEFRG